MSVQDSIRTPFTPDLTGSNPALLFSLNDIFNEQMRKADLRPVLDKAVVRCETLPMVAGNREDMASLFNTLISLIVDNSPAGAKLFLYVDCEGGQPGLSKNKVFMDCIIKFHTNLTTNEDWKTRHKEQLSDCERIISRHKGSFQVNNIYNTGCLFAITLPGKIH